MKYIIILVSSIIITSCGIQTATTEYLIQINNRMTLAQAKEIFEDIYEDEDIVTKKIGNKSYTILVLRKITTIEKETYKSTTTGQGISYDSQGNPTTKTVFRNENKQRYNNIFTKFYIVFDGEKYVFSGYGYEAKISSKSDLLTSLFGFRNMED